MSKIYPLFSSSKGNSTYIGTKRSGILVDAGVSCKRLVCALENNDLSVDSVKAVFITHEHTDHIKALPVFTKRYNIPVYAMPKTLRFLEENNYINSVGYSAEGVVSAADMEVTAFHTPHDAAESCGYRISMPDGGICGVCTDLGYITEDVEKNILGCNAVILEANYDEKMLTNGSYPYPLKNRIRSKLGHLSNNDSGKFAKKLIENGTTRIILGHLSQENNTPTTAYDTVSEYLSEFIRNKDYILQTAPVETAGECVVF